MLQKAHIEAMRTQSPTYKWARLKLKKKNKGFIPGQVIDIHLWAYGTTTLPIASAPSDMGHYELLVSNTTVAGTALQQTSENEEIEVSTPKGKGFNIRQLEKRDVVLITDNAGLGAILSLIPHLMEQRKQFGDIVILSITPEPAEILMKEKIKEIQREIPFIIQTGAPIENFSETISYNPLKTKALVCVSKNIQKEILDYYIKPLGISYKDTFIWNKGDVSALM